MIGYKAVRLKRMIWDMCDCRFTRPWWYWDHCCKTWLTYDAWVESGVVRLWDMIYSGWDTICNAKMCDDLYFRCTLLRASPNGSDIQRYGNWRRVKIGGVWIIFEMESIISQVHYSLIKSWCCSFFCGSYKSHASIWHDSFLPPAPTRPDSPSLHQFFLLAHSNSTRRASLK